jgi:hypothetical protein
MNVGSQLDTITDFDALDGDLIDFSGIDADAVASGDQAFTWIGASAFSSTAGELRQVVGSGDVRIEGDVDGDGVADFAISVIATAALAQANFVH